MTSSAHPDFGSGLWEGNKIGIPYVVVPGTQSKKEVVFEYADESDPGPYPIPDDPPIEGGSDHHILIIDQDAKMLYELYAAELQPDGSWYAGSGAIFDLNGYALRPNTWTSADAAGLAILPGLVRYEEVVAGEITHAIRFTTPSTQRAYVWPARHYASSITDPAYPPMGQRFRLKASFDTSGYPPQAKIVLNALKKYGMMLADNGGALYLSGVPDERWDNDDLHTLSQVKGSDFEAVDSSSLMIDPDSGQTRSLAPPTVISIIPSIAPNTGPVSITNLSGTGFQTGAIVNLTRSGETNITATDVVVTAPDMITCTFLVTGKAAGAWNVMVTNIDGNSGMKSNAFTITAPAPIITSISPTIGYPIQNWPVTINGTNFRPNATITISNSTVSKSGDLVSLSATQIVCILPVDQLAPGVYDVIVQNEDLTSVKMSHEIASVIVSF